MDYFWAILLSYTFAMFTIPLAVFFVSWGMLTITADHLMINGP